MAYFIPVSVIRCSWMHRKKGLKANDLYISLNEISIEFYEVIHDQNDSECWEFLLLQNIPDKYRNSPYFCYAIKQMD